MYTIKITMGTLSLIFAVPLYKNEQKFFEWEDASDANGFKIPPKATYELDASPKRVHQ